ncbi:hypothetical protein M2R47_02430 [Moraxella sp. Tifton1]|nr:hypothetical protein [Moraxella sp. Tifton1]
MLYKYLTYHRIGEKNLFILPSLPNSVVLNDLESITFHAFAKEQNIEISEQFLLSNGVSPEQTKVTINSLLEKLKSAQICPLTKTQLSHSCNEVYPTDIH